MSVHDPETLLARRAEARRRRRVSRRRLGGACAGLILAISGLVVLTAGGGHAARPAGSQGRGNALPGRVQRGSRAPSRTEAPGRTIQRLQGMGLPVYCGGRRGRYVALTFDDGPGPYTRLALAELRVARARATFFLVGRNLASHRDLVGQEFGLGALGDHTYTHPYLPALPAATVGNELSRTQDQIAGLTGQRTTLFRPPYGARSTLIDRQARRLGMLDVLWSIDSGDALGADKTRIAANVAAGARPGAIILMHENRGQTIVALRRGILPMLRRRHLRAVTVSELLTLDPPTPAQLRAGGRGCQPNPVNAPRNG